MGLGRPQAVGGISAVGYYFASRLRSELDVPVGVIDASWGGTCAEHWTSREALVSNAATEPLWEEFEKSIADYDPATTTPPEEARRLLQEFRQQKLEAQRNQTRRPAAPGIIGPPASRRYTPCNMYNTMIHPLVPYGIRGVLWYQGESNRSRADQYETLLPVLIDDWRSQWSRPDLPFGIVQLANLSKPAKEPRDSEWAELQWAQFRTVKEMQRTGLAVINDGADVTLHPGEKKKVGDRLARWAFATIYERPSAKYSGPVYRSSLVQGSSVVIRFDHADGLHASDDQPLQRFQLAAGDRKWVWANAIIEGDTVIVSSPSVAKPVAARYAWSANPAGANLTNASGLPASLFRTDSWPGITNGKRVLSKIRAPK